MRLKITTPGREFEQSIGEGKTSVIIGNRPLDDVTIADDPDVSGPHVRMEKFAGNWSFTDQFSGSGTIHNGEKKYTGDLKTGDVLKLGASEIRVLSLDSAPVDMEPRASSPPHAPVAEVENILGWIMRELDPDDLETVQARPGAMERIRAAAEKAVDDLRTKDEVEIRLSFNVPGDDLPVYLNVDLYPRYLHKAAPPYDEDEDWVPEPPPVPAHDDGPKSKSQPVPERREPPSAFVERITEKLIREFEREHGLDVGKDRMAKARVLTAAREAVVALESSKQTDVNLPFLAADGTGPKHLKVTIERRHLHEDVDHFRQGEARQPAPEKPGRVKSPGRNQVVGIGVSLVVFVLLGMFAAADWLTFPEEEEPIAVQEPEVPAVDDRAAELELRKKVLALMESKDAPPQELLDQLDEYENQARVLGYPVGWDYERCRTHLESRVYRDVSQHYNDVARTLFDLREANKYRHAEMNVTDLKRYLARSPQNERAIKALDLDETIQGWSETHRVNSSRFVARQILVMQEAISRNDYAPAIEAMARVIDGALLDEQVVKACETLLDALKQRTGEARKPFHYRDRPPKSPENALLPKGDSSGYSRLNAHENKVVEALRAGEVREFEVWGMHAIAEGEQRTSQLTMTYALDLGADVRLEGVDRSMLSNLPDAVRLALLMQDEQLASDALTGMLVFAFDNGLFEQAGEIAYRLRRADPEKKAELDEILSVKWNTPVPESGFPERDGRVVIE